VRPRTRASSPWDSTAWGGRFDPGPPRLGVGRRLERQASRAALTTSTPAPGRAGLRESTTRSSTLARSATVRAGPPGCQAMTVKASRLIGQALVRLMAMRTLADGRPALRSPPTLDELRSRRDEILAICARHGASNVRVFGSVATGEADENSDLDLLVDMERGRSLFDLAALIGDLEDLLGCAVDAGTGVKERVRSRVQAEAVPL
jgi:uncharacterized protein